MGTGFDLWNFDFIKAELKKIFGNYRNYNKYLKENEWHEYLCYLHYLGFINLNVL